MLVAPSMVFYSIFLSAPATAQALSPEREMSVHDLPVITARSTHAADVLAASLETVLRNPEVRCAKNSALDDALQAADPHSLKDVASRIQGRHLLSDGRPIAVTTEYLTPTEVNAGHLIYMVLNQHAALMEWDSRLYVVTGVTYVENTDYTTNTVTSIVHKFLLQDVRFSDSRREAWFDRLTDDAGRIQGLLFVDTTAQ
jgi:hypothetical protein